MESHLVRFNDDNLIDPRLQKRLPLRRQCGAERESKVGAALNGVQFGRHHAPEGQEKAAEQSVL